MNNFIIAEVIQISALQDQQLFKNNKININLKIYLKKAKITE